MAQVFFFANDADLLGIWSMLFELPLIAYPDPHFGDLPAPALCTVADAAAQVRTHPDIAPALGYFLVSKRWSEEPLVYKCCVDNPHFQRHASVVPRKGGPAIEFIPRFGFPGSAGDNQLIIGFFGDYPSYYSGLRPSEGVVIPRPDGLKETMARIRQGLLKNGSYVRSPCGRRAIALSGALAEHANGSTLREGDIVYTANKAFQQTRSKQRAAES